MQKTVSLIALVFILLSCSSDDGTSNQNINDTRYKLVFDFDNSGKIIGDQSNTVLKSFDLLSEAYASFIDMHMNEQSGELFVATRQQEYQQNGNLNIIYSIGKIKPIEILESDAYTFTLTNLFNIPIDANENLTSFQFISDNDYFVIVENNGALSFKRYSSGTLVEVVNLTSEYDINDFFLDGIAYSKELNRLIIIKELFPNYEKQINIFNLSNWNLTISDNYLNSNLFSSFSNSNGLFLIGKKENNSTTYEYLLNEEGNIISQTDDSFSFISRAAIGYDNVDNRFEYIQKSDGRKETGTINVQTGEINRIGIVGEPGFHSSRLVFFNK